MSHSTLNTLIGLFLFANGLLAFHAAISPPPPDPVPQASADPVPSPTPAPTDRIQGIGPATEEVLAVAGRTETLGRDEMGQIPPEVARVLVEQGVVLTIPSRGGR